jgi:hypothetical protein
MGLMSSLMHMIMLRLCTRCRLRLTFKRVSPLPHHHLLIDSEILNSFTQLLTVELAPLRDGVLRRTRRVASKKLDLDEQREATVEGIDKFFGDLISKARERAETLKAEYLAL